MALIRKPLIALVMLVLIISGIIYLESLKPKANQLPPKADSLPKLNDAITKRESSLYAKAPDFIGIDRWINSEPLTIEQLRGKVVLVDFWTYTCINCIRTLPYLKAWHEKYKENGLVIVGVHTPEFNFEKKYENVLNAVNEYGLKYAIAQDNEYATWHAYQNRYWPRKYLIDINGNIRYDHAGEGAYEEIEKVIQELLKERMEAIEPGAIVEEEIIEPNEATKVNFSEIGTPELYFGYKFVSRYFGNKESFKPDEVVDYSYPKQIEPNNFYLVGKWLNNKDNMELAGDEGVILLWYKSKVVNIVAGSNAGSDLSLYLDDQLLNTTNKGDDISQDNMLKVTEERLYNLVSSPSYEPHILKIIVNGKGFKIYTFTFG